jgi:hypothetical protein
MYYPSMCIENHENLSQQSVSCPVFKQGTSEIQVRVNFSARRGAEVNACLMDHSIIFQYLECVLSYSFFLCVCFHLPYLFHAFKWRNASPLSQWKLQNFRATLNEFATYFVSCSLHPVTLGPNNNPSAGGGRGQKSPPSQVNTVQYKPKYLSLHVFIG